MPEMLLKLLQKEQFKTVEVTGDLVGNKTGDENESTENSLRKPKTTKKKGSEFDEIRAGTVENVIEIPKNDTYNRKNSQNVIYL